MKVKRLGIMFFLLVIVGCGGNVTKEEIDTCANICKPNGGVKHIHVVGSSLVDACYCSNGVHITMYEKVIKGNKSK